MLSPSPAGGGTLKVLLSLAHTLGLAGVFGLAFFDSSLLFALPGINDFVLISFVISKDEWIWAVLAAVAATAGSVFGARLTYRIAHRSGAEQLKKRVPAAFRERILGWTARYGALPVGIAALLPPPFPYAPFVLSAGVVDVPSRRFSRSVAIGRGIRYLLEAVLAEEIGRRLLHHTRSYYIIALKDLGLALLVLLSLWLLHRMRSSEQ